MTAISVHFFNSYLKFNLNFVGSITYVSAEL